tara:strand:+ start:110 stop:397 length:288 start_codon:yes stop_codon:yes gene_type:complete
LSVNNESENKPTPRAWNNHSTYNTFEEADKARSSFLEKNTNMQAKVRRRDAKGTFSLKTRLLAEFVKQETKKSGKSKRRNKKATNDGKFDPSATV